MAQRLVGVRADRGDGPHGDAHRDRRRRRAGDVGASGNGSDSVLGPAAAAETLDHASDTAAGDPGRGKAGAATATRRADSGVMTAVSFRAMGSDCRVYATAGEGALATARHLVERLERLWSRFRVDSELCAINARAGSPVTVSEETAALVALAVDAWRETGGRFDPTVLPALLSAGYRSSFDELDLPARGDARPAPGCAGLVLAPRMVRVPAGVALDLGGIGKGRAADLAVEGLLRDGAGGAMADLGGDIRVAGTPPDGAGAWTITVDDPHSPGRDLAQLSLTAGAVATSSVARRAWRDPSGKAAHHLIDPRTGAPAASGVTAATVIAGTAVGAEVLAKAALVAGPREGAALVASAGATGLLVLDDRTTVRVGGIDRFEVAA